MSEDDLRLMELISIDVALENRDTGSLIRSSTSCSGVDHA